MCLALTRNTPPQENYFCLLRKPFVCMLYVLQNLIGASLQGGPQIWPMSRSLTPAITVHNPPRSAAGAGVLLRKSYARILQPVLAQLSSEAFDSQRQRITAVERRALL